MSDQPTVLTGQVVGVHARAEHNITKLAREAITAVAEPAYRSSSLDDQGRPIKRQAPVAGAA